MTHSFQVVSICSRIKTSSAAAIGIQPQGFIYPWLVLQEASWQARGPQGMAVVIPQTYVIFQCLHDFSPICVLGELSCWFWILGSFVGKVW